jgi:lipopolysaccharide biosynthesis protein
MNPNQKKQLYWWFPFIVKKSYTVSLTNTILSEGMPAGNSSPNGNIDHAAILIHVYYIDILEYLLETIYTDPTWIIPLYVTTRHEIEEDVTNLLRTKNIQSVKVVCIENKGRDIGAFLAVLPQLHHDGIRYILKLHTKKSLHLKIKKTDWLQNIINKLILQNGINSNFQILHENTEIGLIAPAGHILPMAFYYGLNTKKVLNLTSSFAISEQLFNNAVFIAGSMCYIKLDAIRQLVNNSNNPIQFENEEGQTDGTTAHAIERIICLLCQQNGYGVVDTNYSVSKKAYTVFTDYIHAR